MEYTDSEKLEITDKFLKEAFYNVTVLANWLVINIPPDQWARHRIYDIMLKNTSGRARQIVEQNKGAD